MADIFLSYKREDSERARQLERALRAEGWSVFWDPELLPGETYRSVLTRELDQARCVIALWSRLSVGSEWVMDEAEKGKQRDTLVSVRIDDVEIPLGFRQGQAADLIHWAGNRDDAEFQLLARGVARHAPLPAREPARSDVPLAPPITAEPPEPPIWEPPTPPQPPPPPPEPLRWAWLKNAARPTLLLVVVFLINYVETSLDELLTPARLGAQAGYPITYAFRWFEGYLSFASHDATNLLASHGYAFSYFFVLPLLCLFVAWNLARRADPLPYRTLSVAVAIDYLASLPFFLFFPVPERWSFLDSEAMLLSDKWSDKLIEAIRPISGLDNSFPSFHVSLTVLVATACFLFEVPLRKCVVPLGATVVLATFVLGVHWLPDMLAGFALGLASMLLAWRLSLSGRLQHLWA